MTWGNWGEGVGVGVGGFVDDAELGGLCDEGPGAVAAVELQASGVEFAEEFVG